VAQRPLTLDQLAAVRGVGPARRERFGADLLALIAAADL
jgi:hypothetical protein